METKKQAAKEFLKLCAKGSSREAFRRFVGPGFKHHNVYFKGDGETLMMAMEEAGKENPDTAFDIQRALEDGDLVAVHSHIRHKPNDRGYAVIHIMRFANEKIEELWDFGQEVPEETVNENGMF